MNDGNTENDQREPERPDQNQSPVKRPWVPWTLRRPFLCSLAGLFLLLAVVLEVLRQVSERKHGLVLYKTVDEMPKIISGLYIYLPVAVAVLAVTLWQFCAADALRLEPYFQLARPEGVPATALFTNYTFRPDAMAPIVAARDRHWLVLLISILSVSFRIALPSLLSGLVVLTEANLEQAYTVTTWPKLLDQEGQKDWFTAQYIRQTNDTVILNSDEFFLFRSFDYTSPAVSMPIEENETSVLSLNQTVYWSELTCQNSSAPNVTWTRQLAQLNGSKLQHWRAAELEFPSVNPESPCVVNFTLNSTIPQGSSAVQLRYWEPIPTNSVSSQDHVFQTKNCGNYALLGLIVEIDEGSQQVTGHTSHATAFACSVRYRTAEALVKLGVDASMDEVDVHSSTVKDLSEKQFFDAGFHDVLYHETTRLAKSSFRAQHANESNSVSTNRLPFSSLVLDLDQESFSQFIDPFGYQTRIKASWNSKFVAAMSKLFDVTVPTNVEASQTTTFVVLQVLSTPATSAETFLIAAAIMLLFLGVVYPRRPNFLQNDPGSVLAQCAVVADLFTPGNPLTRSDDKFSRATSRQLRRWAKNFKCQWTDGPSGKMIDIVPLSPDISPEELALPLARRHTDRRPHFVILPWFLAECVLLTGTVVTYGLALSAFSVRNLNYGTKSQFGFLVFLMFGPTLIASLVGSLLASILRSLTIIETWGRLQKGKASFQETLKKNYGSHIPTSILFHNLGQGPTIPIALSIICTLGFLLTIVSGGMFESQTKSYTGDVTNLHASYDNKSFHIPDSNIQFDGIGLMLNHLNRGTPILPWQDDKYSFLPLIFSNFNVVEDDTISYNAITVGLGADLDCHRVYLNQSWTDHESGLQNWNYTRPSGLTCTMQTPEVMKNGLIGRAISYLQPSIASSNEPGCQSTVLALARWETMDTSPMNAQNSVSMSCDVSISMNDFEVTFSGEGIVSSAHQKKEPVLHGGHTSYNMSQSEVAHFNQLIMSFAKPYNPLGNGSFFDYDWPGMMAAAEYDRLQPDSELSFDPDSLITAVQSTYQQIFRAYLTFSLDLYFRDYPDSVAPNVEGTKTTTLWGLFPSPLSIIMALVLLSLDVVIVVIIFVARSTYFRAPRIPTSLGSLMPWIAGSNMISDMREMSRMGKSKLEVSRVQSERVYRFGLSRDGSGDGRWILDYDDSSFREVGHELDQIPHLSSARRRLRERLRPSRSAEGEVIASSIEPVSYVSRCAEALRNLVKRRLGRPRLPP
ncbi:unnamed protein product [Penicillium olsonii]|nr:unnamed protein product [Penicillium olsonii]